MSCDYPPKVIQLLELLAANAKEWRHSLQGSTLGEPLEVSAVKELGHGDALVFCRGQEPPLVDVYRRPVAGTLDTSRSPATVHLTLAGEAVLAERRIAGTQKKKKRTGRPRKNEPDGFLLVQRALVVHHRYEEDGSVGNHTPASLGELVKLSSKTKATVSRYLKDKLGENGYAKYKAACNQDRIGQLLTRWTGDVFKDQLDRAAERGTRTTE